MKKTEKDEVEEIKEKPTKKLKKKNMLMMKKKSKKKLKKKSSIQMNMTLVKLTTQKVLSVLSKRKKRKTLTILMNVPIN